MEGERGACWNGGLPQGQGHCRGQCRATDTGPQVDGATAEHGLDVETACDREIAIDAGPRLTDHKALARGEIDGSICAERPALNRHIEISSRHCDATAPVRRLIGATHQRELDTGFAVRIVDEPIGQA